MSNQISPEVEASLIDEAKRQGLSVDTLLERLVSERKAVVPPAQSSRELPSWELGAIGALRRRDIYDDVP